MSFDGGNTSTEDLNNQQLLERQQNGEEIRAETERLNNQHQDLNERVPNNEIQAKFEEVRQDTRRLLQNIRTNTQIGLTDLRGFISEANTDEERVLKNPRFFMKKIKNYTDFEARVGLKRSQQYYEKENSWGRAANTDKLSQIQSRSDRDGYQENLMKDKIYGEKMYDNITFATYSSRIGYSLVKIEEFEQNIITESIESIDTETLKRYILMLEDENDGNAQEIIKEKIGGLTRLSENGVNSEIIRDALKFGGYRAKAIEIVNNSRTVENVKGELKKGKDKVSDPIIRDYIKKEISKLRQIDESSKDWEGKDWSILLLSIVMKQTSRKAQLAKGTHNDAQDNLISKIQSKQPGVFIKGYSGETSNYLIRTEDFKARLEKRNIRDINSRALANYLDLIAKSGNINDIFLIGVNKLNDLKDIWLNKTDSIAKGILEKRDLGYIVDIITDFAPDAEGNIIDNINALKPGKQQSAALEYIRNNIGDLKEKFKKDIVFETQDVDKEVAFEKLFGIIKNSTSLDKLIIEIDRWKNQYNVANDTDSILEDSTILRTEKAKQDLIEANILLQIAEDNGDTEKLQTAERQKIQAEENLKTKQQQQIIVGYISENDIYKIARGDKTVDEVVEEMKERDEDFAKKMEKFEETEIIERELQQAFASERTTAGTYTIETPQGEKIEGLTPAEFKEVSESKEARNNLVDMKHILEESNLDYFWENRNILFTAIGNMNTLGFDTTDGNYVNPAELKFILAMVVSSIKDELGEQHEARVSSLENTGSLAEAINLVKDINGESGVLSTEDVNHFGDSKITQLFIDKFIPRESSQVFNHSRFQESFKNS